VNGPGVLASLLPSIFLSPLHQPGTSESQDSAPGEGETRQDKDGNSSFLIISSTGTGKQCKRRFSEAQSERCEHHHAAVARVPIILVAVGMSFIQKAGVIVVRIYYTSLLQISIQEANKLENILKLSCPLDYKTEIQV